MLRFVVQLIEYPADTGPLSINGKEDMILNYTEICFCAEWSNLRSLLPIDYTLEHCISCFCNPAAAASCLLQPVGQHLTGELRASFSTSVFLHVQQATPPIFSTMSCILIHYIRQNSSGWFICSFLIIWYIGCKMPENCKKNYFLGQNKLLHIFDKDSQ